MTKSPDAFRTISEVAEWLDRPAHVLRFWESKFSQVKPVKRAGGRRYYRPQDMQLLGGIKKLLHDDGMTIKGVQKLLREKGIKHVIALSQPLDESAVPDELVPSPEKIAALKANAPEPESATLLQFPSADDIAEEELSTTTFESAVAEYVPEDAPAPIQGEPAATRDETQNDEEDFAAPSFFSMFDDEASQEQADTAAATDITPPENVPPPLRDTASEPEEPALLDTPAAPDDNPQPMHVDIAVDAQSDKAAGVLTQLMMNAPRLAQNPPREIAEIREQLRGLHNRLAAD
jgi:DNA-binding transcriptional MerR regulator